MMLFAIAVSAASPSAAAAEHVKRAIADGGQACAAGNPQGSMATVDRDLVLSYPDAPDVGYDQLAEGYGRLCRGSGKGTVEYLTPDFEEVTVNGNVAVARLIWSTHLRGMPDGAVRMLRDFQVWRKTSAGWRFWRGVHWPYSSDKPR